jgi:hypothetical protein
MFSFGVLTRDAWNVVLISGSGTPTFVLHRRLRLWKPGTEQAAGKAQGLPRDGAVIFPPPQTCPLQGALSQSSLCCVSNKDPKMQLLT